MLRVFAIDKMMMGEITNRNLEPPRAPPPPASDLFTTGDKNFYCHNEQQKYKDKHLL